MPGLLDTERFFVNQKAKLIEINNEYKIMDEEGNQIGAIRQEGQSKMKKLARALTNLDQYMTVNMSVYDAAGTKVLGITRPRKFIKSKVLVTDGQGQAAGSIEQQNMIGKIRFSLIGPGGEALGGINAENWRAWNFQIADAQGAEIGRITKKWAGMGKELFTTADNYMVEISGTAPAPLRVLAFAAAAAVDTALKQNEG